MRKTGMTAQDVINVLTILKANDSTSFSKIQRALKMSISQLEGIIDGLRRVRISTLRNENETFSQLNSITYIGVFLRLVTYSHLP